MRKLIAPFAPLAKLLLAVLSVALVSYGFYDAVTLSTLIGTLTSIATAFWIGMDKVYPPKE